MRRFPCAAAVATLLAAPAARAEGLRIVCTPTCVTDHEPPRGEATTIRVEVGGGPAQLAVASADPVRHPCALPCTMRWPGLSSLVVLVDGRAFPVEVEPGVFGEPEPADEDGLDLGPLFGRLEVQRFAVVGGSTTPVFERPEERVYPKMPIPQRSSAASSQIDLDRYFEDVVLVGGAHLGCTGIVLASRAVLTARHCGAASTITVTRTSGAPHVVAAISRAAPPDPRIDAIVLTTDVDLGVPVRHRIDHLAAAPAAGVARIVGFGANDPDGRLGFGTKRQAYFSVSDWSCSPQRALATGCLPSAEIVITTPQADTCRGDSGGPLLELAGGEWRLVGITSRAISGHGSACGGGGIYTDVGALQSWLATLMTGTNS